MRPYRRALIAAAMLRWVVYQIYRFSYSHSIGLVLLTVFDAVIVYLTAVEYRKRRHQTVAP
jgi:uncharacterized membrane protein